MHNYAQPAAVTGRETELGLTSWRHDMSTIGTDDFDDELRFEPIENFVVGDEVTGKESPVESFDGTAERHVH